MNLLNANKKHMKTIFCNKIEKSKNLFKSITFKLLIAICTIIEFILEFIIHIKDFYLEDILSILKKIGIAILIITLLGGPFIKTYFFPSIIPFTAEEVKSYKEIANYVMDNGLNLNNKKLNDLSISSDSITKNDLLYNGLKNLDLNKIHYSNTEKIFIAYYDDMVISCKIIKTDKGTFEICIYISKPVLLVTSHSISFTFSQNDVIIEDLHSLEIEFNIWFLLSAIIANLILYSYLIIDEFGF